MWLFNLLFSSLSQLWYVEVRISKNVSVSPLEFEITGVDCIFVWSFCFTLLLLVLQEVWAPWLWHSLTQLAFYVNLHRAVIGPSATLAGRWRPDIDLRRMLTEWVSSLMLCVLYVLLSLFLHLVSLLGYILWYWRFLWHLLYFFTQENTNLYQI